MYFYNQHNTNTNHWFNDHFAHNMVTCFLSYFPFPSVPDECIFWHGPKASCPLLVSSAIS